MCFNVVLPSVLTMTGAVTGSYMVFTMSKFIEDKLKYTSKLLQGIGKETYLILAFSQIIVAYMNHFFALNSGVKYGILVFVLYLLSFIRKWSKL